MTAWNAEMGAFVLRVDNPKALPKGIFETEGSVTFLKDGAFLIAAGTFEAGRPERALAAAEGALDFGKSGLAFHDDSRGVFWAKLEPLMSLTTREIKVPGRKGKWSSLDLDYSKVVKGPGLWIPLEDIERHLAETKAALRAKDEALEAAAEPAPAVEGGLKNVVVLLKRPKALPAGLQLIGALPDGTILVVGPKSRTWVEALKRDPGPASLRLIRGPVQRAQLTQYPSFSALDQAMRAAGAPMLVMPG